ncbi:MAG: hypothetical protein ACI8RD_003006 [Bacillariaceae sp.]|jgi:hypothetical protein
MMYSCVYVTAGIMHVTYHTSFFFFFGRGEIGAPIVQTFKNFSHQRSSRDRSPKECADKIKIKNWAFVSTSWNDYYYLSSGCMVSSGMRKPHIC